MCSKWNQDIDGGGRSDKFHNDSGKMLIQCLPNWPNGDAGLRRQDNSYEGKTAVDDDWRQVPVEDSSNNERYQAEIYTGE